MSVLLQIIKLQNELNIKIDKNWLFNRNHYDFVNAVVSETAELLDSYGFKWWKKQEIDEFNIKVELVDIFHFIISDILLHNFTLNYKIVNDVDEALDKAIIQTESVINESLNNATTIEAKNKDFNFSLSYFIYNFINSDYLTSLFYFFKVVNMYFSSFEEFFRWYFVKNVLNEIRQLRGYKSGEYVKIVDGMEDNQIIYNFAKDLIFIDFNTFKQDLINKYINYMKNRGN